MLRASAIIKVNALVRILRVAAHNIQWEILFVVRREKWEKERERESADTCQLCFFIHGHDRTKDWPSYRGLHLCVTSDVRGSPIHESSTRQIGTVQCHEISIVHSMIPPLTRISFPHSFSAIVCLSFSFKINSHMYFL